MKKRNRTEAYIRGLCTQIRGLNRDVLDNNSTIAQLQRQITKIKEDARGSLIVNWTPHNYCQSVDGLRLANLKAGDQVAIIGWVTDTKTWLDKGPHSSANFDIRETKKVSGFLTK